MEPVKETSVDISTLLGGTVVISKTDTTLIRIADSAAEVVEVARSLKSMLRDGGFPQTGTCVADMVTQAEQIRLALQDMVKMRRSPTGGIVERDGAGDATASGEPAPSPTKG